MDSGPGTIDLGFSGVAGGGLGEGLGSFLRILPAEFENRDAAREFMARECPDPSIAQYLMAVSMRAADGRISFPFDRAALLATIEAARDASVRGCGQCQRHEQTCTRLARRESLSFGPAANLKPKNVTWLQVTFDRL